MKFYVKFIAIPVVAAFLFSCSEDDKPERSEPCGEAIIISNTDYEDEPSYTYSITDAAVEEDCLKLMVSSSGCDGSTWEGTFFTAEPDTSGTGVIFTGRMDLTNQEACLAIVGKEFYFDLTPLQVTGSSSVTILIDGWEQDLEYTY